MAYASLGTQLLSPQVLTKVVSQYAQNHSSILDYFGFAPGGANCFHMGEGRTGAYHIYNHTRKAARGKAPGTAAAKRSAQPMGQVPFVFPRAHDSVELFAEDIHNLGKIDDPAVRDEAGEQMIARQGQTLGEMIANFRVALTAGLLRGKIYAVVDNEDWYLSFDVPSEHYFTIDSGIPAGNLEQLEMISGGGNIIDASWATATTNIPGHLGKINAAFQQLCGGRLERVFCTWNTWNYIIQNEYVQATHGTSNPPFVYLERSEELGPDGVKKNYHLARLNVMPQVEFHITDEGVDLGMLGSEDYQKIIPDNYCSFVGGSVERKTYEMREGSEPIAEYDGAPINVKRGMASWSATSANPTKTQMFVLDNCLPINYVPKSLAFGNVIY